MAQTLEGSCLNSGAPIEPSGSDEAPALGGSMEIMMESAQRMDKNTKKKFFQADNPYNEFMSKLFDIIWLNILWLIFCIPVVTIGASTSALYYVMLKLVRGEEGGITASFVKFFRNNFRKSLPYTLALLLFFALMFADFYILRGQRSGSWALVYGVCLAILLFGIMVFSYVFPYFSRFDNPVKETFNNAWRLAVTHMGRTAGILAVNCLPFIWFLLSPATFASIFWIWFFCGEGISAAICSLLLNPVLDELMPE